MRKKTHAVIRSACVFCVTGNFLLSRVVTNQVPSAFRDLTPFCGPKGRKMDARSYVRMARRDAGSASPGCHLRQEACLFCCFPLFSFYTHKKTHAVIRSACVFCVTGNFLLSQVVTNQVPSALRGLTSVFGMGTGVSLLLSSPDEPSAYTISFGQVFDRLVSLSYIHCCTST